MKKLTTALLCVCLMLMLASCGDDKTAKHAVSQTKSIDDVIASQNAAPSPSASAKPAAPEKTSSSAGNVKVDFDLTALSSTMVYSTVYLMLQTPDRFKGKTVKMRGPFSYFRDEFSGNEYFACIIEDATACCAQGLEFILSDEAVYPDDYPTLGTEITVIGVFDTYLEDGYMYCTLRSAMLV